MSYNVSDKISVYHKHNGKKVGVKGGTAAVSNKIACTGNKIAVNHGTYSVSNAVLVKQGIGHKVGFKSGEPYTPIPYDNDEYYNDLFGGYGTYLWQIKCVFHSPTRDNLGLYLIKRLNDSNDLTILDITKIRLAEDDEVCYGCVWPNGYTWQWGYNSLYGNHNRLTATDYEIYILCGLDNKLYRVNKTNGDLIYHHTFPGVAGDVNWVDYDGSSFYSFYWDDAHYAYRLYRYDSVFNLKASLYEGSGRYYAPPLFFTGDGKIWFYRFRGSSMMAEANTSDLTLTGDTGTFDSYAIEVGGQNGSGNRFWYHTKLFYDGNWHSSWTQWNSVSHSWGTHQTIASEYS